LSKSAWPEPENIEIRVSNVDLGEIEADSVKHAIASDWISGRSSYISTVANQFAELVQTNHAQLVCNGSVALRLALSALKVGAGDEVIIPSLTYVAVVNSVIETGALPVIVDVSRNSWNAESTFVLEAITSKTKAVIAVHSYGNPIDLNSLRDLLHDKGIALIEDCSEAILASIGNVKTGNFGIISTYSFFANKIITSGEGGAITTSSAQMSTLIKSICSQGTGEDRYVSELPGFNFRMGGLQAALLAAQVARFQELWDSRSRVISNYRDRLQEVGFMEPQAQSLDAVQSPWIYTATIPDHMKVEAKNLAEFLARHGIETRPVFFPNHKLDYFKKRIIGNPKNSEHLHIFGISLPTSSRLTMAQQERVIDLTLMWANSHT
jgi:perosamine synthetase